jgi:hypothetical protein
MVSIRTELFCDLSQWKRDTAWCEERERCSSWFELDLEWVSQISQPLKELRKFRVDVGLGEWGLVPNGVNVVESCGEVEGSDCRQSQEVYLKPFHHKQLLFA